MTDPLDVRLGARVTAFPPLPPFVDPGEVLADVLPVLDPPSGLSVTDAAEAYVRVESQGAWQNYDRGVTPYMVEPGDMTASRRFKGSVFTGAAQSGKTLTLQTVAAHAVACDPGPTLIIHMTRGDRDTWVEEKLDPMIRNSPALRERLGTARDDDTFGRKRFRGMRLYVRYPTPTVLSGGTYRRVLLTDYDHMPQSLGGKDSPEGSPWAMALPRIRNFLSRGIVMAESTPAFPVKDPAWRPSPDAPHMLPPATDGIVNLYNEGTRGRWYWECPNCRDIFEPRFDRLVYDDSLDPGAAGEQAEMGCPHCGTLIGHQHKFALNRAALTGKGGWWHEGRAPGQLVRVDDPEIRRTQIVSHHLNGAAATFSNWAEMVAKYETAKRKAIELGDEADLRTVHYTDIGISHRSVTADDGDELSVAFLRDHLQPATRGTAPDWARFITVSVDVQGHWFAVQVTAWGEDARSQVVDRFDITQPPEGAPGAEADEDGNRRRLDPSRFLEDWDVLLPLAERITPVEGAAFGLMPLAVVVDFHGKAGVSDNAEAFWKGRRKAHAGGRWFLSRGQGGWRVPFRIVHEMPERGSKGKKARTIKLLTMATDRIKDTIDASLRKAAGGVGAMYLPEWMREDEERLGEYVSEDRGDKGWTPKVGVVRNEGLDLSVQARALAEHKGLLRIDWSAPPPWATGGPENTNAVPLGAAGQPATPDTAAPRDTAPRRRIPSKLF